LAKVKVTYIDVNAHKVERRFDSVAEEKPLHLFLNRIHYATILCYPTLLKELAVGYLLSEGLLKSVDEISKITMGATGRCIVRLRKGIEINKRITASQPFARLVLTACGSPDYWPLTKLIDRLGLHKVPSNLEVRAEVISNAVRELNTLAQTFRKTGGVHIAALYKPNGDLVTYAEDIGRHNAVDKVIGICALKRTDITQCFLASSGRLTGDIILKAARMGIPIVASLAAAVDSGIQVAKQTRLTLIGFVRGHRMNVFTFPNRVITE
jgi:FdhD protein